MLILLEIIEKCKEISEKILVFSQSVQTLGIFNLYEIRKKILDCIEKFIYQYNQRKQNESGIYKINE